MKKACVFISILAFCFEVFAQTYIDFNKNNRKDIFEDASYPISQRVENLLSQMTMEEKQGQLLMDLGWNYYERKGDRVVVSDYAIKTLKEKNIGSLWGFYRADPWAGKTLENGLTPEFLSQGADALQKYVIENTRLGIPVFIAEECMHGVMQAGSISYPTGIGQAATWNTALIEQMAEKIAAQSMQQGVSICFSPLLDVARDARWSRVEETYGEDAYLTGKMGESIVKGLTNPSLSNKFNRTLLPCLKHFAAYGISEGGHNAGSAHIGLRELNAEILPPFKKAIKQGAKLVMTAYNEIDGIPCTMNSYLLGTILRDRWQFDGMVISDLHSISGLQSHGVAKNLRQAAELSISAGVDIDLSATDFYNNLQNVDTSVINSAVRRVLYHKFESGLFEMPYLNNQSINTREENKNMALQVANESLVLLENKNNTLPLNLASLKKIALIGPNADNIYNQLGDYTGPQDTTSVTTIKMAFEQYKIPYLYAKGCGIKDTSKAGFAQAIEIAKQSDVIVLCVGGSSSRYETIEYENTGAAKVNAKSVSDITSGEGFDRSSLQLAGVQMDLFKELKKLNKPIVVVLINGRPLILTDIQSECDAMLECFYPGAMGGRSIVSTLVGENNPSGHLPISFPKSEGQIPCYYNTKRVGNRSAYLEGEHKPLYCFGYGLSYTEFQYQNFEVSSDTKTARVTVSNTGNYDGKALVQLYIRKKYSRFAMNEKDLCAFEKINLKKGESKTIELTISDEFFKEFNADASEEFEIPGEYELILASDSQTIISSTTIVHK